MMYYDVLLDHPDAVLQLFAGLDVSVGAQLVLQKNDFALESSLLKRLAAQHRRATVFAVFTARALFHPDFFIIILRPLDFQ